MGNIRNPASPHFSPELFSGGEEIRDNKAEGKPNEMRVYADYAAPNSDFFGKEREGYLAGRIESRRAWFERVKRARIAGERKRWERRAARWRRPKPAEKEAETKPEAKEIEKAGVPPAILFSGAKPPSWLPERF